MNLLATLRRTSISRGVLGGSRPWLVTAVALWALRGVVWAIRPTPTRVYRGRLDVGETLVIRHDPAPPTRRRRRIDRRRARRADRREARAARRHRD